MTIGSSSMAREHGVLKLVHPKGKVELHKSPITAAEVMKRNPRHCVARPDVFKYPWIVVRPESVLRPGKVYFVVPNHTLRRLLEANGLGLDHSSRQRQGRGPGGGCEEPRLSADEVDSIYDRFHDKTGCPVDDELARFRHLVRKRSPRPSQSDKIVKRPSPRHASNADGPVHETLTFVRPENDKLQHLASMTTRSPKRPLHASQPDRVLKTPSSHAVFSTDSSIHETLTFVSPETDKLQHVASTTTISPRRPLHASQNDKIVKKPSPFNPKLNQIPKGLQESSIVQEKPNPHLVFNDDGPVHETLTFVGSNDGRTETVSKLQPARLKSCLKKHQNDEDHQKRGSPRVRFEMPVEGQKGSRFRVFHFQRVDTP